MLTSLQSILHTLPGIYFRKQILPCQLPPPCIMCVHVHTHTHVHENSPWLLIALGVKATFLGLWHGLISPLSFTFLPSYTYLLSDFLKIALSLPNLMGISWLTAMVVNMSIGFPNVPGIPLVMIFQSSWNLFFPAHIAVALVPFQTDRQTDRQTPLSLSAPISPTKLPKWTFLLKWGFEIEKFILQSVCSPVWL